MNKPRFKIGDKVARISGAKYAYFATIISEPKLISALNLINASSEITECPYYYKLDQVSDAAWDYQLVHLDVYNSPLYQALNEKVAKITE
jgi:hypothetical protein